jgi:very-short-patch-repair endonuclease
MTKSEKKEQRRLLELEKEKSKALKRIALFKEKEEKYKRQLLECRLNPDNRLNDVEKKKVKYNILTFKSKVSKNHKSSCGEKVVQDYLIKNKIPHKREVNFEKLPLLRFDFYLPDKKVCIEFDGIQHYESVPDFDKGNKFALDKRIKNDKRKNIFCKKNGLKLIRIKYDEYWNINKLLKKLL